MTKKSKVMESTIDDRGVITGTKIQPGTKLKETDLYQSSSGAWKRCACPGIVLGKTETLWMRPE